VTTAAAGRPSYAEASRTLLRDTVLDGVGELLDDRAWSEVSMSDVAARAGVSRQTLYNTFGGRSELARAYVLREAGRFMVAVEAAVRAQGDPHEALAAALEVFLSAAADHPLVRAMSAPEEGDELLALVTTRGGPVIDSVTDGLATVITDEWPAVALADSRLLADCLVRLAISHAALPSGSPSRTAERIARVLGPYADRLLAEHAA